MRALVISPFFPPIANSESFCGGKFALALIEAGIEPKIIYCTGPGTSWSSYSDHSKLWKKLDDFSLAIPNPPKGSPLSRVWLGLRYRTNSWIRWTQAVVEEAKKLHSHQPFDVVISRALPWHAHLVGYWVATTLHLPWVTNFNDPWDPRPFCPDPAKAKTWKIGLNEAAWMRRTMAQADLVTFPCERLRDHYLQSGGGRTGVLVIPHIGTPSHAENGDDEFRLVHAGKLGMHELTSRPTTALLQGFADFLASRPMARGLARLVLVGPEDSATQAEAEKLGLAKTVTWAGWVSYEKSLEYIAGATVCLLVESDFKEGIFLPSKLSDYLVARKPVLALSPAVGTVNDLAQEGGIARVSPNDSKAVTRELVRFFDAFRAGTLSQCAPTDRLVRRFESKTALEPLVKVFSQMQKS